jgi:hypothetical protein
MKIHDFCEAWQLYIINYELQYTILLLSFYQSIINEDKIMLLAILMKQ